MEEYIDRKPGRENGVSRRGSSTSYRDKTNENRSTKGYNRLEGSIRHSSAVGTQIGIQEKFKYTRASSSVNGKALAESSCRPFSASSSFRRSLQDRRDQPFLKQSTLAERGNDSSIAESSSREKHIEDSDSPNKQGYVEDLESDGKQEGSDESDSIAASLKDPESFLFPEGITESSVNCTTASSSKLHKQPNGRLNSGNHDTPSSSAIRRPTLHRSSRHAAKPVAQVLGTGSQKYGLKNLGCASISDVFPSGCSPAGSTLDRRVDMTMRMYGGESSTSKSKCLGASSSRAPASTSTSGLGLSIPERIRHQQVTRTRSLPNTRDVAVSVRTRRASSEANQTRLSIRDDDSTGSLEEPIMIPGLQRIQFSNQEVAPPCSSRSFTIGLPHEFYNSSGRLSSSSQHSQTRMASHHEDSSALNFHGSFGDVDGYRPFNTEGVTEVLLALEQIERDAALSYEQLLMLETTFLLSGLSFHDQHRDMRMDIDNMTYEELIALEERIGNVSTALSEDQLSKSLEKSIYGSTSLASLMVNGENDMKCSICQEEYVDGDEVGNLLCEHLYHVSCIEQWLRQKNWCPVCKSSALPS